MEKPAGRCSFPKKTPHYGHREERRGRAAVEPQAGSPHCVRGDCGPLETYTFTPPNPSLMGAAKSFPNKKRVPTPACSGPLKSIYRQDIRAILSNSPFKLRDPLARRAPTLQLRPPSDPTPGSHKAEVVPLKAWPIRVLAAKRLSRQRIGSQGGAVSTQDANQNTQVRESEEWTGKAGRPQRREARGSERPGGPVVGGLGGSGGPQA